VDIRLLGVVEATVDGRSVPLRAAKPRAVLAMLALAANSPVSSDRLIEGLWGEHAPASAGKLVQLYVSQLRKLLGPDATEILTRGRGYELRVSPDAVDALRFERLATAQPTAREALALWRGSPLDDLADEPFAAAEVRRLEELRVGALELVMEDRLAAGEHGAVIAELRELVQAHPLRERLRAQLMLALYRSGRQAESLEAYADARRALVEGLGIEPSRELRDLQQAILAHDLALETAPLPVGTVTFLLTDIEGSTRLWESARDAMSEAVRRHYEILDAAVARHGGVRPVEQGEGDSVVAVFVRAPDALAAAVEAQGVLHAEQWPGGVEVRVRMALHTGDAQLRDEGNYFGPAIIRCARLRGLAHGGQVLLSRATHDLVADRLPDGAALVDLGLVRLRDLTRPEHVFALSHPDLAAVRRLAAAHAPAHNLPHELSSFVGRARELGELREALSTTRLLTVTGPGGAGKTRLALRAAWEAVEAFPDGVWWVELGPLTDERLVNAAVAEALGVRPLPGMTELQTVSAYLAGRRALLILDNCEHLSAACADVAETLLQATELVVLATSRVRLGARGETDWRVPPLAGPDAVSLFAERARNVRPQFAVDGNAGLVAEVCRDLDGLPLAIELAAARLRVLSADQVAAAMSDRFRLLTGGPRTVAERQQTLRASVDWSHDLLSDDERRALRRVAVFAGGFTLAAAEEVCAGDGIEPAQMLDLIAALVDQSLVSADEDEAGVRYRLLETVREYGLERLDAAGETAAVRGRHREHFAALAEQAGAQLDAGGQRAWFARLDPEAANLAAAVDSALGSDPRLALRLCAALHRWWLARGRLGEAELASSRALDACREREPALRSRVLNNRAWVAVTTGDPEAASDLARAALALAEEMGDQSAASRARSTIGEATHFTDPPAGRSELTRAAELARAAGDDWAFVTAGLSTAFTFMYQQDHARAAETIDEVAAIAERLGDPHHLARRWFYLGWMALMDGRFAQAHDSLKRMLAAVDGVGDPTTEANADICVAFMEIWEGEPERALERLQVTLDRALTYCSAVLFPMLMVAMSTADLAAGRCAEARDRLAGILPLIEGRDGYGTTWALCVLAEAQRMLGDESAETTAANARASGERLGNPLLATRARFTSGRLAAARGDWRPAREHVVAHLETCVDGGHATHAPACLDALGEVAAGVGADRDATRLFAAAERARADVGIVRIPPEAEHWAAIDRRLRVALGDDAYNAAWNQGAGMSIADALSA
jgi:predicted ATPase/DNA-binding SARP family transcriptional activator